MMYIYIKYVFLQAGGAIFLFFKPYLYLHRRGFPPIFVESQLQKG